MPSSVRELVECERVRRFPFASRCMLRVLLRAADTGAVSAGFFEKEDVAACALALLRRPIERLSAEAPSSGVVAAQGQHKKGWP